MELATYFNDLINIILSLLIIFLAEYSNLPLTSKLESKPQDRKNHLNKLIIKQQTLTVNVKNCNVTTAV